MFRTTNYSKMSILSKDKIKKYILPHLSFGKTGCQWQELPLKQYIEGTYTYQSVHYHFSRWVRDGSWKRLWMSLLKKYKNILDMSCVQLDGTQTRAHQGGEAVGFQARRADECTNFLCLSDNQGILLGISEPISGNHHDVFDFEQHFKEILNWLQEADIQTESLFG